MLFNNFAVEINDLIRHEVNVKGVPVMDYVVISWVSVMVRHFML